MTEPDVADRLVFSSGPAKRVEVCRTLEQQLLNQYGIICEPDMTYRFQTVKYALLKEAIESAQLHSARLTREKLEATWWQKVRTRLWK